MVRLRLLILAVGLLAGCQAGTGYIAWAFDGAPALGRGLQIGSRTLYPPWSAFAWRHRIGADEPKVFASATSLVLFGAAGGLGLVLLDGQGGARRQRGWGDLAEARRAGVRARFGSGGARTG